MSAARYIPRAPRYVFRPEDERLMRFAGMETKGSATRARLHDLSSTGIAFVVDDAEAPFEQELLKVEFGLPTGRQVAWFATVVRVETRSEWDPEFGTHEFTLVGLKFRQLPQPFTRAIERSLSKRMDLKEPRPIDFARAEAKRQLTFVGLTAAMIASFVVMALPAAAWLAPFRAMFR